MKEFLLLYRTDYGSLRQATPEEMAAMMTRWMEWFDSIAAQGQLVSRGNRLEMTGRVVSGNDVVTNGPYAEIKESLGGYSIVTAESYEAAVEIAKGCPVLKTGGKVEVREVVANPS